MPHANSDETDQDENGQDEGDQEDDGQEDNEQEEDEQDEEDQEEEDQEESDDDYESDSGLNNDPEEINQVSNTTSPGTKRVYRFVNRRTRKPSNNASTPRSERWLKLLDTMTETKLRGMKCCRARKCFEKVDFEFYKTRAKEVLAATPAVRRATLNGFRNSDGSYSFNRIRVCVRFLKSAFHFSTYMISCDRRSELTSIGDGSVYSVTPRCPPPEGPIQTSSTSATVDNSTSSSQSRHPSQGSSFESSGVHCAQKTSIISFLVRLSEDCSDRMPNKPEVHLPFFRRSDVYNHFVNEYNRLYPSQSIPASSYFMRVWRQSVDHIKVRRTHAFTVCDECEQLRRALHAAVLKSQPTEGILEKKARHIKFVNQERLAYACKRDRARMDPTRYLSVIIDGADQSAFGLPHFVTTVKSVRGHALKVKLIGVLHHAVPNSLHLLTMTEDHETGSNHIV